LGILGIENRKPKTEHFFPPFSSGQQVLKIIN
jgi:hypothetical protein